MEYKNVLKIKKNDIEKYLQTNYNEELFNLFKIMDLSKHNKDVVCDYIIDNDTYVKSLIINKSLNEKHIKKIIKKYKSDSLDIIDLITIYQILPDNIIKKYYDLFNWFYICKFQHYMSISTIYYLRRKILWHVLCKYKPNITKKFIDKFYKYIIYDELSKNQKLSVDIILYAKDKLNWNILSLEYPIINNDILQKLNKYIIFDCLKKNPNVPIDILYTKDKNINSTDVIKINKTIDILYILKHKDRINFKILSMNKHLSTNIIELFKDKLNMEYVFSYNSNITLDFIKKFKNDEYFIHIFDNKNINKDVLIEIKSYLYEEMRNKELEKMLVNKNINYNNTTNYDNTTKYDTIDINKDRDIYTEILC